MRKIGAPGHPEYGIGAVIDGTPPQTVINDEATLHNSATLGYIERETQKELAEIDRRRKVYLGTRQPIAPEGRNVVLVDDGLATGSTMKAAVEALRAQGPSRIVVAVPVGSPETCRECAELADEIVCARAPDRFAAVGQWYVDFSQTTDEEVRGLLHGASHAASRTT